MSTYFTISAIEFDREENDAHQVCWVEGEQDRDHDRIDNERAKKRTHQHLPLCARPASNRGRSSYPLDDGESPTRDAA